MARLSYRPISLDDLEPYAEFLADRACTRYLLFPEPHSRELSRSLLERNVAEHDGTIGMYTLTDGDELIGWAGFGRRELTGAGPERVIHLIQPDNAASVSVAAKLGARWERELEVAERPVSVWAS